MSATFAIITCHIMYTTLCHFLDHIIWQNLSVTIIHW
jgi:hypothetical protein